MKSKRKVLRYIFNFIKNKNREHFQLIKTDNSFHSGQFSYSDTALEMELNANNISLCQTDGTERLGLVWNHKMAFLLLMVMGGWVFKCVSGGGMPFFLLPAQ